LAIGLGLAFGHAHATTLEEVTRAAAESGATGLRTAPGRALLVVGVTEDNAERLADIAQRLGFIVRADDPRRQIVACAGASLCAPAETSTRALEPSLAKVAVAGADAPMVHLSGCAKGCACPRSAPLTVVGIEGRCGVVVNGSARDEPIVMLMPEALPGALSRCVDGVQRLRAGDESIAEVLSASIARRSCICSSARPLMPERLHYLRDGSRTYERSFAIIRAEADLSRCSAEEADVAVRMVHACGCVEVTRRIAFGEGLVGAARAALARGRPILCDSEMVAQGVTRARLPAQNEVVCTLHDPRVAQLAEARHTTRSAAALDLWQDRLGGALVAIGNAPTALFRLLEMLDGGAPKPAAILGIPVGFVGAAEAKDALAADSRGVPFLTVLGRMGG